MSLRISKLRYTSRYGYEFEFQVPGSVVLKPEEVYMLLLGFKGTLTQDELDKHFNPEEQKIIRRYEIITLDKCADLSAIYSEKVTFKAMKREFRDLLALWMEWLPEGAEAVIEKFFGWHNPNSGRL